MTGSKTKNTPTLSYKLFTNDVGLRVSDSTGFMLGAKYAIRPKAAIYAGVEHTDQTIAASLNDWSTQISSYYNMPIAGLVTAKAYNSTWGEAPIRTLWVGGDCHFTENMYLEVGYYNVNNGGDNHNNQYTNQQFSLMPSYIFSKHFDVYAGLIFTHYTGPYFAQYSPPALASNNVLYGIGFRARLSKNIK